MPPSTNMSNTPVQDPPTQGPLSGSGQTLPSRPLQPTSEPSVSKRVCFYKSGDHKFSGHRMIITARTFKTFDALLDALSKKVPLPFGVRTITTPRGTHLVKALEDLQDGGAYVCSDQKRVKPLNLDEVNRRQVPWNTTRLLSAGRRNRQGLRFRQLGRGSDATKRPAKVTERVAVRTPKKLLVIKNRDPTAKRTIVLQRRTAPTFDALLDYLSQIFQFPVLKLYSTDGRRVDGLAALILCSGVVVAAGNEPYRLGNYNFQGTGQMAQIMFVENVEPPASQPKMEKNKSLSSGRGSRNFSLSSERFIVNQINKSQNGSLNGFLHHPNGSSETEACEHHASMETRGDNEPSSCTVPHDDDIEKSFCVNPDGSMTVEMKVRLTIKEEEMLHWTTTLSRSSLSKRTLCASGSGSGNNSPDSNNTVAKDSSNIQGDEFKEENDRDGDVRFNDEQICESYTSTSLGSAKTRFKRMPTPGPRHVNKRASVENVKVVSQAGVQESTTSHYSYMERTDDGETAEEYCIVRHSSSSSSSRPIPKPRKTPSSGKSSKRSSVRTSDAAEVHQIQKDCTEVTETVMHIYESQGCYDNYFANKEYNADSLHGSPPVAESKPSTDSRPHSSSNDCDIDCTWQPPTAESLQRQKEEMLSLSSEPESLKHQVTNISSSVVETEAANTQTTEKGKSENTQKSLKKKKMIRPTGNRKSSASTSSTERKRKEISTSEQSKKSSPDKLSSDASVGKKSVNSETSKRGLKKKGSETKSEKSQSKISVTDEKMSPKQSAFLFHSENVKTAPPKKKNSNPAAAAKDNCYNVNTPNIRPQMKKNMSDILQTRKSPSSSTKTLIRPKSLIECRLSPPKVNVELSDSGSIPSLNPSPSEIHQYVEKWLEKVSPDSVPYTEEVNTERAEPGAKVVFKIGDDSESDELNEPRTNVSDAMKKSSSCLSVPLFHEGAATSARGLCVSMPSVRADPLNPEYRLRLHRSAEAIGPDDSEMSSNTLSPREKIKPALRQLCSSIQCIRRASTNDTPSTLQNSNSLPNFSTQVATVFGSSCKAFLSFLSVMTLRDSMKDSIPAEGNQSRTTSEARLMMESLQKISAIEDEKEQWASLTDLQSRASSQFRERWKDFQILRERLESEPLSPRVSETEFALDVVSEGGDLFEEQYLGIDELMQELNMPQDLRAEITSTIQHTKSFYPMEESTFAETIKNHSDSEEDVEQFITEYKEETTLSPELKSTAEDINETKQENDESDDSQELHTELDVPTKDEEVEGGECVTTVDCENTKETDEKEEWEIKEDELEGNMEKEGKIEKQEDWVEEKISDTESVEKGSEEELTGDEEITRNSLEGNKQEATMEGIGLVDEETGNEDTVQDTDEREGDDETETEENSEGGEQDEEDGAETLTGEGEENLDEEENRSEGEYEEMKVHEVATTSINTREGEERHFFIEDGDEAEEEEEEIRKDIKEKIDVHEKENRETDQETDESTQEVEGVIEGGNEKTEEIKEEDRKFIEEVIERISDEEENNEVKEESEPEEDTASVKDTEDEKSDQVEAGRNVLEKESAEEEEVIDELEAEENMAARQSVDEERDSDEENEINERLTQVKTLLKDETEAGNVSEDSFADNEDCKHTFQQQHTASCEEANLQCNPKSPSNNSSEVQCEDDKGRETVHETDEGGEECEENSSSLSHPVEISQELLDFVNDALQSYSLVFTYDTQGNIRIIPDNARVVQTKQSLIPKARKDNCYGLKSLPSPITSDLSDYRPETSGSGGYKTQESVDIVSESGEEFSEKPFSFKTHSAHKTETTHKEHADKELSVTSSSGASQSSRIKSAGSFCSSDTGTKASREDLSYFSAASSLKADTETETQSAQCVPFTSEKDLADGVLIDRGRWLLKENHLIRKSPPVSLGMYGNLDSTSVDTAQDNISDGSPPYTKTQHNPLAAISSSELEEMAKPLTPKCTYFNMPHGSDSDPFLDDNSIRSAKHDWSSVKGRGFRVSPTVDTSKTWAARNGSLSSFASVEFKIPDSKVHPEGESSSARQTRRTSNGEQGALQPQDSLESLHLRCGQYCPIL